MPECCNSALFVYQLKALKPDCFSALQQHDHAVGICNVQTVMTMMTISRTWMPRLLISCVILTRRSTAACGGMTTWRLFLVSI